MSNKKTARIVGVLYIIGTIAGIVGVPLLSPSEAPDYLIQIANNKGTFTAGTLLILVMGFALAMIPILMYPVLRKSSGTLAISYIVVRGALETFTYIIAASCFLLLSSLSAEAVAAGMQNASIYQVVADNIKRVAELPMTDFVFGFGALIFYFALFKSKITPNWIPLFGIAAIVMLFVSGILKMFGSLEAQGTADVILNAPIAIQEMVMAVWFIVKGFKEAETA